MLMFTRKTSLVWIGILILAGMFLMGQEAWEPTETLYVDGDEDGYGSQTVCTDELICVENNTDCDDADSSVNPEGIEIVDNGKDDDCDPATIDDSADIDDDEDGYTENEGDCDDADSSVNPGLDEVCTDGKDTDCDGQDDVDDPNCSINFSLSGSGETTGSYTGLISGLTGTATLDLTSGDLEYEYSGAEVNIQEGDFIFVTSESATISGTWSEATMTLGEPTTGSGTMETCVDDESSIAEVCPQFLTAAGAEDFPIPSAQASGVVGSIDFNPAEGTPAFTVDYDSPIYEGSIIINFTLTEQ